MAHGQSQQIDFWPMFCYIRTTALFFGSTFHGSARGEIGMYAVIQTGGKQYRVSQGDMITVEKLAGEPGDRVEIASVLMVGEGSQVTVGRPHLEQTRVVGTIVRQTRGPKVIIFKHKRRKGYQKKQGHRQWQTLLRVMDIMTGSASEQG
jgi:large subunit ribosomal protein L21